ncbi:MAG: hypothetical protein IPH45_21485 [Bacteroidales bacterium]|nr:hypothetical protein [Bacteroidales bacterium]
MPVFALLLKLLYIRHKQYFYVDHAILSLHYFSFIFLLLVISHYVLGKLFNTDIFTSLSVLWILAWLFIAMKKIYAQSWKKTFLKFTLLGFVFSFTILLPFYEPDLERFYALRILHINPMLNRNPLSLNLRQLLLGGFILLILFSCKKDPSNEHVSSNRRFN